MLPDCYRNKEGSKGIEFGSEHAENKKERGRSKRARL
jgi:hypothetical protein